MSFCFVTVRTNVLLPEPVGPITATIHFGKAPVGTFGTVGFFPMACRGFLVDGLFHQYGINNINIKQIVDMIKSNIATNIRWIWLMSDDGIEMKYTGEDD